MQKLAKSPLKAKMRVSAKILEADTTVSSEGIVCGGARSLRFRASHVTVRAGSRSMSKARLLAPPKSGEPEWASDSLATAKPPPKPAGRRARLYVRDSAFLDFSAADFRFSIHEISDAR